MCLCCYSLLPSRYAHLSMLTVHVEALEGKCLFLFSIGLPAEHGCNATEGTGRLPGTGHPCYL